MEGPTVLALSFMLPMVMSPAKVSFLFVIVLFFLAMSGYFRAGIRIFDTFVFTRPVRISSSLSSSTSELSELRSVTLASPSYEPWWPLRAERP